MTSEWMKVMLGEISRKKTEAELARIDEQEMSDARARIEEQGRSDGCVAAVVVESDASGRENQSDPDEHPRHRGRGRARP